MKVATVAAAASSQPVSNTDGRRLILGTVLRVSGQAWRSLLEEPTLPVLATGASTTESMLVLLAVVKVTWVHDLDLLCTVTLP